MTRAHGYKQLRKYYLNKVSIVTHHATPRLLKAIVTLVSMINRLAEEEVSTMSI